MSEPQNFEQIITHLDQLVGQASPTVIPLLVGAFSRLQARAQLQMLAGHEPANSNQDLLTIPEVAERLKISDYRAYELARQGVFKSVRLGKSVRVRPEDLAEYLTRVGS